MDNAKTANIIKKTCKSRSISVSKMLQDLGIRKGLIYDMEKRNKTLSADTLEKIADYLNCSIDYLLGRTNVPDEEGITDMIVDLNEEQLKQLIAYMEFLKAQQDADAQKKD